jgi:asparagine synthase (glutamine-hydrolysing)
MCGIAGYYGLDSDQSLLETMNSCIAHRGPDGEGYYIDGSVGLAHRRLAIIDRAGGAQPMHSSDQSVTVAYNGEIYNYKALREELETAGRTFVTESDTEVLIQAYQEWGDDCFDKFNGMFAIALHDKTNNRFVLVRDHFGIKPLYYANVGDVSHPKLVFASEISPILKTELIEKKPNDRIVYRYLKFRIHEEGTETFFAGVNRLAAGEMMIIDAAGLVIRPYTNLKQELAELAKIETPFAPGQIDEYREKLIESVRLRLQSEVPVGTSLSGGLDSSAVVAIINQLMQEKAKDVGSVGAQQNTFSAIFPNSLNDEEKYVDAVLAKCEGSITAHKIKPTADEFAKDIYDFIRTQEEPLISTGPYAQYKVMQEATNHVTVLLDGQGADEMMAGYIPYYFVYLRQLKARGQWVKLFTETATSFDVLLRLTRFKLQAKLLRRKNVPMTQLLNGDFKKEFTSETFTVTPNHLKHRLIEDLFGNSLPSLLRYEDRNTMHFGLEGRVPFLDKEVVKYLFSLSDEAIIHHGWNKRILRDAVDDLLPEMITKRRNKIGFTTPEVEWFMRLKNRFYGIFLSEEFAGRKYFDQNEVLVAFEGFIQGKNDTDSMLFWRLLNVELWLREFFDEKKPEEPTREKTDYEANNNKQLDIKNDDGTFRRYPIKTDLFAADTDLDDAVKGYVKRFFGGLSSAGGDNSKATKGKWYVFISEKVVAITQGRSYFIWDIKVSRWARLLSRFVTKTPYGIGLGSPWTMQLAIQEVGLLRVLYASVGGFIGKLLGKRGVFYNLVGDNIRAIDGPTEYSVYPANVSAKLAPKDPDNVAAHLSEIIRANVPAEYAETFGGTVVMDANDIGRNALGKDTDNDNAYYEAIFADNPLGQSSEQTPIAIVFEQK